MERLERRHQRFAQDLWCVGHCFRILLLQVLAEVPRLVYLGCVALNDNITRCRVAMGLSYEDVARRLGIKRRQWWRMETDRIRILAVEMPHIARALDTTISALYGEFAELRPTRRPARRPTRPSTRRRRAVRKVAA